MKWLLLVLVPAAFVGGIIVGRKTVSPPAPVAELKPPPPSLPVVEPVATVPATMVQADSHSDADALAQMGLEAYVKGQYQLSIRMCGRALAIDERQPLALRVLGAVRCKMHDRDGALSAYKRMEPQFRNFVRMVCHSQGVELD
jgi:hypothetical protein